MEDAEWVLSVNERSLVHSRPGSWPNWSARNMSNIQLPPHLNPKPAGCAAVWHHYVQNTTILGIGQILHAKYAAERVIWAVIFIGLSCATFITTYQVVATYLTYPVSTTTTVTHEESLMFPTVTICNRNPVPCHQLITGYLKYKEELGRLMEYSHCWESAWKSSVINMVLNTNHSAIQTWQAGWQQQIEDYINEGNWTALGISDDKCCLKELGLKANETFTMNPGNYFILVEECEASLLSSILFPEFHSTPTPPEEWDDDDDKTNRPDPGKNVGRIDPTKSPKSVTESQIFLNEYASLFVNKSRKLAFEELIVPLDSFVVNCFFQAESCRKRSYFVEEIVPQYGTCYTFNSKFSQTDPYGGNRTTFLSGKMYGLTLDVMMNQAGYMPSVAASGAGGRIVLARPGVRPNVVEDGYYFAPHTETDFAMHQETVTRQASPYTSECWEDWDTQTPFIPVIANSARGVPPQNISLYSSEECHELCESRLLIEQCDCVNPYFISPYFYKGVDVTRGKRICDFTGSDGVCFAGFLQAMKNNASFACPCNLPCEEHVYDTSVSTSTWPSDAYMEKVVDKYLKKLLKKTGEETIPESDHGKRVASEFARVNVYFRTLNVEWISEEPVYDAYGILSNAGGALSLYLGICGVTVFEIAALLIMMILALLGIVHKTKPLETISQGGVFYPRAKSVGPMTDVSKPVNIPTIKLSNSLHGFQDH